MSLIPEYFSPSREHEMISPLLMTILEQFKAKVLGELMSTEAAGVVLCWLRRVVLGLSGKMGDATFLEAVVGRIEATLRAASEKGQARLGLGKVLTGMKEDMKRLFGSLEQTEVVGQCHSLPSFPKPS